MLNEVVKFEKKTADFIWDKQLHFPIPTANYVLNRVGIDVNERHDTMEEANGTLLAIARTAKNYAYRFKGTQDRIGADIVIATDIDVIYQVLEFIMEFVAIYYTSGTYLDLFNLGGKVSIPAIDNALRQLPILTDCSVFAYKQNEFKGQY